MTTIEKLEIGKKTIQDEINNLEEKKSKERVFTSSYCIYMGQIRSLHYALGVLEALIEEERKC